MDLNDTGVMGMSDASTHFASRWLQRQRFANMEQELIQIDSDIDCTEACNIALGNEKGNRFSKEFELEKNQLCNPDGCGVSSSKTKEPVLSEKLKSQFERVC